MTSTYDGPAVAHWMDDAACTGKPLSWFFPNSAEQWEKQARAALALCRTCLVQAECLQFALDADDKHGIFGGLLPHERHAMKRNQPLRKDSTWLRH
jgi:WhiB family redox-sensing transcriptional regulator